MAPVAFSPPPSGDYPRAPDSALCPLELVEEVLSCSGESSPADAANWFFAKAAK